MLLAIDIGNSNIAFGIYDQGWVRHWRISTIPNKTGDEYFIQFHALLTDSGISPTEIQQVVMSSVVPPLIHVFQRMLQQLTQQEPLVIDTTIESGLSIATDNPHELGTDLLANAVAGYQLAQTNCVIVDFGTALSFTVVNHERVIIGVAIAPGLESAVKALSANTAQLPFVPLSAPPSVLGKNTIQAIQSGILFGYVGLVEGLVSRIQKELETSVKVIATGGLAEVIAPIATHSMTIEPWLTLDGLRLLSDLN